MLCLIFILLTGTASASDYTLDQITQFLHLSETKNQIPKGLLVSLCRVESSLNYKAIHYFDKTTPSYGLCQIKLATANLFQEVSATNLLDPGINSDLAGQYLRFQFDRYRTWHKAINAYNRGSTNSDKLTPYTEKVLSLWAQ